MKTRPIDWKRDGLVALALIALTQLPFWVLQARIAIQRPLLNLDTFVAIVIMLRHRGLGLFALAMAWMVEINQDASVSYHFVGAVDLVDAARFMDLVKLNHIFSWQIFLAVGAFVLCGICLYRLSSAGLRSTLPVLLIGVLAFVLDGLNGSNYAFGLRDRFQWDVNVAGSPSVTTMRSLKMAWITASEPMVRFPGPITFDRAVQWHDGHPGASMMIVLVESMGLPASPPIRDWLASRLDTPEVERRWKVQRTAEGYYGSTVYGELRVLCGLKGHYSRLKADDEAQCLPRRFMRDGGDAVGLHGFNLRMFDRQAWWPDLGLRPQDLSLDAASQANVGCNDVFPGVCDGILLQRAAMLTQYPRRLVYAVTLDTHLPLPSKEMSLRPELATLCLQESLSRDACQMVNRLAFLLDQLQADLVRMPEPVLVLVSGDHAPPFLGAESRNAFDRTHVQGFILEPR